MNAMKFAVLLATLAAFAVHAQWREQADTKNGFDVSGGAIPAGEIYRGGPPRDGIPSIDRPRFVEVRRADFVAPDEPVLAIEYNGVAKAYPVRILNWHEIVNDRFGDEPVTVTWCPLCGSGMAFSARAAGRALTFGVSGLLYNSDVLLYDRETDSLWSQIMAQAVTGPMNGAHLEQIPAVYTTWADWKRRRTDTLVLTEDTGHRRDYSQNPYADYERSSQLFFPVKFRSAGYHPKERVLGLVRDGEARVWPFTELARSEVPLDDTIAGEPVTIHYDDAHQTASAYDADGERLPAVTLFWFAWYAFHPDTGVYEADR